MHATRDGAATIVSYSNGAGIWSVDRPQGGSWSAPALVVSTPEIVSSVIDNVSPVQFLMNANGGQAIAFQQWVGSDVVITAVRRPAGGAWSAQDNVASSATYGDIAIASSPRTNCRRSEGRPQESLTGNSCGSGRLLRDLSRAHAHLRDAPPRERLARALECAVALGARDVLAATVGEIPGLVSVVRVLASDLEAPGFNTVTVLGRRTLQAMLEAAEAAR